MGLESANDFVRNVCINKGLKRSVFERAVKIIQDSGAHVVGHVLFKPPFLTESEAITDAKTTIDYLDILGVRRIILMACNVKDWTLVGELYRLGLYRPPWLWSVIETILSTPKSVQNKLLIYGFKCGLPMTAISSNCNNCDRIIIDRLNKFSGTSQIEHLYTAINTTCSCRNSWENECISDQSQALVMRIIAYCNSVTADISSRKYSLQRMI